MKLVSLHRGHCPRRAVKHSVLVLTLFLIASTVLFLFPGTAMATPTIATLSLDSGQVGDSYFEQLRDEDVVGSPIWEIIGGSLPPGLVLNEDTGVISGTPTEADEYDFQVKLTDDADLSWDSRWFSITIESEELTFETTHLPDALEGDSYSEDIEVEGGDSPYTFTLVSGKLPSGLTLSKRGIISGTPAKGSAGSYTFTIEVTDDSDDPLFGERTFSFEVEIGFYESLITIGTGLSAGVTNVYVDGKLATTLQGGQTGTLSIQVEDEPVISVTSLVSHPTRSDTRFRADVNSKVVTEDSPDATFTYTPEYLINFETDPVGVTSLGESQWYVQGDSLSATAPDQVEGNESQYRFSHWQLPNGNRVTGGNLSWTVSAAGKVIAIYDSYYLLTVASANGQVEGEGWYKAGTSAQWSVTPSEVPMSGIFGFFRGKLKADRSSSTVIMDGAKKVTVTWSPDYTMPVILILLLMLFIAGVAFGIYRLLHPPAPKPVAPPAAGPAPASPTIVFLDGGRGGGEAGQKSTLDTTREQLVQQFRMFLGRYEEDVKNVTKSEVLAEGKLIPEAQRLAAPREETLACGYTSRNLLRTVVGSWRKAEEKVETQPEGTGILISTVWARDIYNEWEVFTCSLPSDHGGKHEGPTEIAYTLQKTVTEERTQGAKEERMAPKLHFTDELPEVDVTQHRIIANNPDITSDDVADSDEVIPPDSLS